MKLRDLQPGQTVETDDGPRTVRAGRRQGNDLLWILETTDGAMTIPLPGEHPYELHTEQLSIVDRPSFRGIPWSQAPQWLQEKIRKQTR